MFPFDKHRSLEEVHTSIACSFRFHLQSHVYHRITCDYIYMGDEEGMDYRQGIPSEGKRG